MTFGKNDYDDYPLGDQDSHKKHMRHLSALKAGAKHKKGSAIKKALEKHKK